MTFTGVARVGSLLAFEMQGSCCNVWELLLLSRACAPSCLAGGSFRAKHFADNTFWDDSYDGGKNMPGFALFARSSSPPGLVLSAMKAVYALDQLIFVARCG